MTRTTWCVISPRALCPHDTYARHSALAPQSVRSAERHHHLWATDAALAAASPRRPRMQKETPSNIDRTHVVSTWSTTSPPSSDRNATADPPLQCARDSQQATATRAMLTPNPHAARHLPPPCQQDTSGDGPYPPSTRRARRGKHTLTHTLIHTLIHTLTEAQGATDARGGARRPTSDMVVLTCTCSCA